MGKPYKIIEHSNIEAIKSRSNNQMPLTILDAEELQKIIKIVRNMQRPEEAIPPFINKPQVHAYYDTTTSETVITVNNSTLVLPEGFNKKEKIKIIVNAGSVIIGNQDSEEVIIRNTSISAADTIFGINTIMNGCCLVAGLIFAYGPNFRGNTFQAVPYAFTTELPEKLEKIKMLYASAKFSNITTHVDQETRPFLAPGSIIIRAFSHNTISPEVLNTINAAGLAWFVQDSGESTIRISGALVATNCKIQRIHPECPDISLLYIQAKTRLEMNEAFVTKNPALAATPDIETALLKQLYDNFAYDIKEPCFANIVSPELIAQYSQAMTKPEEIPNIEAAEPSHPAQEVALNAPGSGSFFHESAASQEKSETSIHSPPIPGSFIRPMTPPGC